MKQRAKDPLLVDQEGHAECLLGNEAIVRGALEVGVVFAAGYPGTPSSEITDSFARVADQANIQFEYSVNEKVALEMAFGASLAGARSICAMKHLGLMYAGDPLSTMPYVGTVGGMVIVSAGDPSCRTSPNEQDQRLLAPMLHLPMLDPSTPQEAYDMARFAFELSERSQLPVIMRPTTRVCHSRGIIRYGRFEPSKVKGFERDPKRFVPIPINARRLRIELKERIKIAAEMIRDSGFNRPEGEGKRVIVASGAPAGTTTDVLTELGVNGEVRLISIGGVYPLHEESLAEMLGGAERILVVEELSPYLEDALRSICNRHGLKAEILGKRTGHFPVEFEYPPELIQQAIYEAFSVGAPPRKPVKVVDVPPRPPSLCPGCPHRSAQFAARTVFGEEGLYFNDIGCYTLGYGPPLNTADALLCMGAGFTLAAGVARVTGKRTVGLLGDSTFFHSGMPGLLNVIKEDVNMVAVILDNQVTAMTGFQESPFIGVENNVVERTVDIEAVVRALGAKHVELVDPYDLPATIAAFERARDRTGVSVVITKRGCPVYLSRETDQAYKIGVYEIDQSRCRVCGREEAGFRCAECVTEVYERHMARSRAMELGDERVEGPETAPCTTRCPLSLCIQGYIGHIAGGEYLEAYNKIVSQVALPESVCRVCHHPCEAVCVRAETDEPLSINQLKRFVMDWAAAEKVPYEPETDPASGRKVAVVGGGPSGLACAHDLKLRGHQVTIFDANEKPGGLLLTGIPAYRLPREALQRDIERILGLGVEFRGGTVLGRDMTLASLLDNGFDAVFLAAGAHKGMELRLEGEGAENTPRVTEALRFLEEVNLSSRVNIEKRVVVVGGGNAALDAARAALRLGAEKVTIAYRRRREEMPALAEEVQAAVEEGVDLHTQVQPTAITTDGLVCVRTEPGESDASGRSRPVPVKGSGETLQADLVISAVGQGPDPAMFKSGDLELKQNRDGTIRVDDLTGQTSHERIFAGGDLAAGDRFVTTAMAWGRRAAWSIDRLLRGPEEADKRPPPPRPDPREMPPSRAGVKRADLVPRQRPLELPAEKRGSSFAEVVQTLTAEQARLEASRCLVCGMCGNCRTCLDLFGCPAFYVREDEVRIDPNLCMGCGVCAHVCPNIAIREVAAPQPDVAARPEFGPLEDRAEEQDE